MSRCLCGAKSLAYKLKVYLCSKNFLYRTVVCYGHINKVYIRLAVTFTDECDCLMLN